METFAPRGKIFGPILPQFVLERPITLGAKIMYALLCNYASEKDHCWPSHATLATRLSCSVSSVKKYLTELVDGKLITIRKEQYRSSVYYLLPPGELNSQGTKPDQSKSENDGEQSLPDDNGNQPNSACDKPDSSGDQPKKEGDQSNSGHLNNLLNQSNEEDPPLPPTKAETLKDMPDSGTPSAGGVSHTSHDYEKAWELYPKKDSKGFAKTAWLKLQRSGQLPAQDELLAAIQRFSASEGWQREQGRYVPQMSNWLRGQRWLDPLSPAEEEESQRRLKLSQAAKEYEEREKRFFAQQKAEKELLRPIFDAMAAKFAEPFNDAMAFGTWMFLHSKGIAPVVTDVPEGNALGIIEFMNDFKRKSEEAAYMATHGLAQEDSSAHRTAEPKRLGDILAQHPVLSRNYSGTGELQLAV